MPKLVLKELNIVAKMEKSPSIKMRRQVNASLRKRDKTDTVSMGHSPCLSNYSADRESSGIMPEVTSHHVFNLRN